MAFEVVAEHPNHLGIVAEVCREIGMAEWLDAQAPTSRQRVSVGTATVAMVLNGLGFSNRQLYKAKLPQVIPELKRQLRASGETAGVYVADSGLYSEANMRALNEAEVARVSRVPETSSLAQGVVREEPAARIPIGGAS